MVEPVLTGKLRRVKTALPMPVVPPRASHMDATLRRGRCVPMLTLEPKPRCMHLLRPLDIRDALRRPSRFASCTAFQAELFEGHLHDTRDSSARRHFTAAPQLTRIALPLWRGMILCRWKPSH